MGRPKIDDVRDKLYRVRVNDEEEQMLNYICNRTGQRKADIFRTAVREYYNRERDREYNDYYEPDGISLKRIVDCPYCGAANRIDLEDECDVSTDERSMGTEAVYEFDTTAFDCEKCGETFRVRGYINEYPMGAFNFEEINVEKYDEDNDDRF